ncbi:hypothetical protein V6615_08635 [Oscillospiraceae bacterium PP1C4]
MKIIEQFIQGKANDQDLCEDMIIVNDHFVCVCDGVTSKSDVTWDGKSSGVMATILIRQAVCAFPEEITCEQAISHILQQFQDFYRESGRLEHMKMNPLDRCQACAIIYSRFHNELWMVGDCQAMVNGAQIDTGKALDDIYANTRALYLECEIAAGKTVEQLLEQDTSRDFILPLIKKCVVFANSELDSALCYGVIDGFPIPEKLIRTVRLLPDAGEIVLASDGYPVLYPTLAQSEAYLQYLLEIDPLCFRIYKSAKGINKGNFSFDDRSYVRIIP